MSDATGTCEYVLDPDDPETWGGEEGEGCYVDGEVLNEDGVWTCPHDVVEDTLCVFHLPVEEKEDEEVTDAFLEILEESAASDGTRSQSRRPEFLGARFGAFDLSEDPPDVEIQRAGITMYHAEIDSTLDWSGSVFDTRHTQLGGIECAEDAIFKGVEFGGETDFSRAKFGGAADFGRTEFEGAADFSRTKFGGAADFRDSRFESATFDRAKFRNYSDFSRSEFGGPTDFRSAEFQGDVELRDVTFGGDVDFSRANFEGTIDFRLSEFVGGGDFSGLVMDRARFDGADLTDARFRDTSLCEASFQSGLLSRATLFSSDLRGARLSGAVLGDVRIDSDTLFLGHPSGDRDASPHTFSALRSQPRCVYDPEYEADNEYADVDKAKSVYRSLEELGGKHARPRLHARSFVRRQDLQMKEYWDDATADDARLEERLIAGARWSRAKVARATLLYGESPWRVIAWSLGIIISFALLYPLGGWMRPTDSDPITYAQIASNPVEILDSIYYSTLTYTALGFGDFQPVGLGRLLTTVETGLGAVMLALLVFILGRRASR